jgi:hypothetical protein
MSVTARPEAERSQPGAQALIAEARPHAHRRRRRMAAALIALAALAAAGVLIGRAVISSHTAARPGSRPDLAAADTGIVTGHLAACFGIPPSTKPWPSTPGTVVVLRGRVTWKADGPGAWRLVYPKGPVVASEHISNNYDQTFRFVLPPGPYVITGHYDTEPGYGPFGQVTVTAGAVIQVNLPNDCM